MGYAVDTEKQYVNGNEVTSDGAYDTFVEAIEAALAFYPAWTVDAWLRDHRAGLNVKR